MWQVKSTDIKIFAGVCFDNDLSDSVADIVVQT